MNSNKPKVSIIVPIYNVEKYLEQCLDSLKSQTYNNIELILVDDGSTDKSGNICDRYKDNSNFIKVFHKKNSGLGLTRNYGLKYVSGQYVVFVDSDDYVAEDFIEKLIQPVVKNHKIDCVIGGFTRVDDTGSVLFKEKYTSKLYSGNQIISDLFPKMLGNLPNSHDSLKPSVWNVLYSTDIIKNNNLKFVSERKLISEDIVWDSYYFPKTNQVEIIDSVAYYYRENPNSLTKRYNSKRFKKNIIFYEYMYKRLFNLKLDKSSKIRLQKYIFILTRLCLTQMHNLSVNDMQKEIKKICMNKELTKIIKEYPVSELGLKQRVFIKFIKNKYVTILVILIKLNKI